MQETQLTHGEVPSVESLSTGERRAIHPLKPPPHQGVDTGLFTDTGSDQAILLRCNVGPEKGAAQTRRWQPGPAKSTDNEGTPQ